MLRLTMALALFLAITIGEVAGADPTCPATEATAEATSPADAAWKPRSEASDAQVGDAARWAPKQARRQEEVGPRIREYPSLLTPSGIAAFPF